MPDRIKWREKQIKGKMPDRVKWVRSRYIDFSKKSFGNERSCCTCLQNKRKIVERNRWKRSFR